MIVCYAFTCFDIYIYIYHIYTLRVTLNFMGYVIPVQVITVNCTCIGFCVCWPSYYLKYARK